MGFLSRVFSSNRTPQGETGGSAQSVAPSRAMEPRTDAGFVVVDLETTGFSPTTNRVVELAVVTLEPDGALADEWVIRLNPEGPVGASHIHGITDDDVRSAPRFQDVSAEIALRLQGRPVIAHNAKFDLAFLSSEFGRAGWDISPLPHICTMVHSETHLPSLPRRRLSDCCAALLISHLSAHSALGDARATASLFTSYLQNSAWAESVALRALDQAKDVRWPSGPSRPAAVFVSVPPSGGGRRFTTAPRPASDALRSQIEGVHLASAVGAENVDTMVPYLEVLLDALAGDALSASELSELEDLATGLGLTEEGRGRAHRSMIRALVDRAMEDGFTSGAELAEISHNAGVLGVHESEITDIVAQSKREYLHNKSAGLAPLPDDWKLGEPLRVGDKVVFTGCDERDRDRLEKLATQLGVRVSGSVSRMTRMLVTDGSMMGTKRAKADQLGTRVVSPDEFSQLLRFIQPAVAPVESTKASAAKVKRESSAPSQSALSSAGPWTPSDVRTWALANGFEVGVRGRLPAEIVDAYLGALGRAE